MSENFTEIEVSEETRKLLLELVKDEHEKGNTEATIYTVATEALRKYLETK